MGYQVRITSPAEGDIYAAFDCVKEVAPAVAERWLREIVRAIFSLREMPERCPIAPESEAIGHPIRHLLFGKRTAAYRIIFDIHNENEGNPMVRILRVWHGRRDQVQIEDLDFD